MTKITRFIRWARDVEWATVATLVAGAIMLIPEIIVVIDEGIAEAGPGTPVIIVVSLVTARLIRSNVWSRATVKQLTAPDLEPPPEI